MSEASVNVIPGALGTLVFAMGLLMFFSYLTRQHGIRKLPPISLTKDISHTSNHPIAVIVPALNEAVALPKTITNLFSTCSLPQTLGCVPPTVIVVDGGSNDESEAILWALATSHPTLRTMRYPLPPSRGGQQTFGAQKTTTPILLFLHADTMLPPGWDAAILSVLSSENPPALGAFTLSLPNPITFALRVILYGASIRARYGGLPYGDQAYFLRRTTFDMVGGFPNVPIMEDLELLKRIRRLSMGSIAVLPDRVETSARRWIKNGVFWNTALNQLLVAAWLCGVPPSRIYTWYYGRHSRSNI